MCYIIVISHRKHGKSWDKIYKVFLSIAKFLVHTLEISVLINYSITLNSKLEMFCHK